MFPTFPTHTNVYKEHKKQSDRVREFKKKAKNSISINKLQEMLSHSRNYEVDPKWFMGLDDVDDDAYAREVAKKEAREDLLEELIRMKSHE